MTTTRIPELVAQIPKQNIESDSTEAWKTRARAKDALDTLSAVFCQFTLDPGSHMTKRWLGAARILISTSYTRAVKEIYLQNGVSTERIFEGNSL